MKKECSIVRDVLPLYFENMVSDETAAFVEEHLKTCSECAAELEAIKTGKQIDEAAALQNKNDADGLAAMKKKIRMKKWIAISITAVCLLAAVALIHYFPVYRIINVGGASYFSSSEIAKLNAAGGADIQLSSEVYELLESAVAYSARFAGFFDCALAPLVLLWGFYTDEFYIPT